jgi:uncharacterized membrane protein
MRNFLAVVFDTAGKAYDGLHEIWELDREGAITVHGTAMVHRDSFGRLVVDTDETSPPLATGIGVGIGALLGALAGPAGAAIGAGGGAAIGAAAGGTAGLAADLSRADLEDQAGFESGFVMRSGQHAVIADVSEDSTSSINTRMQRLGGTIYRRARSDVRDDTWFGPDYPYYNYLYPYEYRPAYYDYP